MPIEATREDFDDAKADWSRLRDCIAGQRAMQRNKEFYLRRPEGMASNAEWEDYADQVSFFEATGRTVEGLSGMAFFNPPTVDVSEGMQPLTNDVTLDGIGVQAFGKSCVVEVISTGRVGVMVDFPAEDPMVRTRRDEERMNRRPFMRMYRAEAAFNWRFATVRSARQLVEVRLFEVVDIDLDEFTRETANRIRLLQLVGNDADGWQYRQRLFEETKQTDGSMGWVELREEARTPMMNGNALGYIPFWFVNPDDLAGGLVRPPLLGLANANVAHFNTTAQLERVLSFIGAPQPYLFGVDDDDFEDLTIGSSHILTHPKVETKIGYLVCPPEGTGPLERRLEKFEQHMALLGARMLSADRKGVEAAETAQIHRQGEVSVLASTCNSVSAAISSALVVMAEWDAKPVPKADCFRIDTKFFEMAMDPAKAVSLMTLWQGGAIAFSDMIDALKRGQIVSKTRTADDVEAEIQSSATGPTLPALTGAA